MTIAISAFPTASLTGTSSILLADGDGSQSPLAAVIAYGLEHLSSGTTMTISSDLVAVIGGEAMLIPLSDVLAAGVPASAPILATNSGGTITELTPDSNWFTIAAGAITVKAFPSTSPLIGMSAGLPVAVALGGGLTLSAGTLSSTGTVTATNWAITDGTDSVSNVHTLIVTGGTISSTGTASTTATLTVGGTGAAQTQDFYIYIPGTLTASQVLSRFIAARALTIAEALPGCKVNSLVGAVAATTITLTQNGTTIATSAISSGSNTGTFSNAGTAALSIAAGDDIRLISAASPDTSFANISITLSATKV